MNISTDIIINWNYLLTLKSKEPHSQIKKGIESALHRTEYYEDPIDKASALFHSLINNHYFLQANKRTALVALLISLSKYDFGDDFLEELILDTVNKKLDVEEISSRLRNNLKHSGYINENKDIYNVIIKYSKLIEKLYYI
jgi:prophage maintenance system killer protein